MVFWMVVLKPKCVNGWKLDDECKREVVRQLNAWLDYFVSLADGRVGNVFEADFLNDVFFFFTDCTDLISDSVECESVESNPMVRRRKRYVFLQLFIRFLLGESFGKPYHCTHCGFKSDRTIIDSFDGGHFTFCPKCGKTDICVFPKYYNGCIDSVVSKLLELGFFKEENK